MPVMLEDGCTSINEEHCSGCDPASLVANWLKKIKTKIQENCCFTITELSLNFPQINKKLDYHTRFVQDVCQKYCHRKRKIIQWNGDKDFESLLYRIVTGELVTKHG